MKGPIYQLLYAEEQTDTIKDWVILTQHYSDDSSFQIFFKRRKKSNENISCKVFSLTLSCKFKESHKNMLFLKYWPRNDTNEVMC